MYRSLACCLHFKKKYPFSKLLSCISEYTKIYVGNGIVHTYTRTYTLTNTYIRKFRSSNAQTHRHTHLVCYNSELCRGAEIGRNKVGLVPRIW